MTAVAPAPQPQTTPAAWRPTLDDHFAFVNTREGARLPVRTVTIRYGFTVAERDALNVTVDRHKAADRARLDAVARDFLKGDADGRLGKLRQQLQETRQEAAKAEAEETRLTAARRKALAAGKGVKEAEQALKSCRAEAADAEERAGIIAGMIADAERERRAGLPERLLAESQRIAAECDAEVERVIGEILKAVRPEVLAALGVARVRVGELRRGPGFSNLPLHKIVAEQFRSPPPADDDDQADDE